MIEVEARSFSDRGVLTLSTHTKPSSAQSGVLKLFSPFYTQRNHLCKHSSNQHLMSSNLKLDRRDGEPMQGGPCVVCGKAGSRHN
jgi:hypothetical protein